MTQTTEGTGFGSVDRVKSKIVNGDVKQSNLRTLDSIIFTEIKSGDGTLDNMDGRDLLIKGGDGYGDAGENDDADGGNVTISGGRQQGDGNSGDVIIHGGDSSTEFENSDAGDLILRGGDGIGPGDSDGGDVEIRGGDCGAGGSDGEAGQIFISGGYSAGSSGGSISISGGDSNVDDHGGEVSIRGGNGTLGAGVININSMLRMPVYNNIAEIDAYLHGRQENGMMCYVIDLNDFVIRVNGSWEQLKTHNH